MHIDDVAHPLLVIGLSLEIAKGDSPKKGCRATQRQIVAALLPEAELVCLWSGLDMMGFSTSYESNGPTQGIVVLRLAGLLMVPVDLVMCLQGAAAEDIAPSLDHLVELARQVTPAVRLAQTARAFMSGDIIIELSDPSTRAPFPPHRFQR